MARRTLAWMGLALCAGITGSLAVGGCAPTERNFGSGSGGAGGAGTGGMAAGTGGMGTGTGGAGGSVMPPAPLSHLWDWVSGPGANNYITSIATTANDDVIAVGGFSGTIELGSGPVTSAGGEDIFVVRFDSMGNLLWARRYGGTGSDYPKGVAVDAMGNAYVVGYFASDIVFDGFTFPNQGGNDAFVIKLSPQGSVVAAQAGGDPASQTAESVAVDSAGRVFVAGTFGTGTFSFGNGPSMTLDPSNVGAKIYISMFDAALTSTQVMWTTGSAAQHDPDITVDANGDVLLTAGFDGTLNYGGQIFTSLGATDVFAAKLKGGGSFGPTWMKAFGSVKDEAANSVGVDPEGNVLLAGTFQDAMGIDNEQITPVGVESIYLTRLSPMGDVLWVKAFGGGMGGFQNGVVRADSMGNIALGGTFNTVIDFGGGPFQSVGMQFGIVDAFVAKFDAAGNHIASRHLGNENLQVAHGLAVDSAGRILVGGGIFGKLDLGGGEVGPDDPQTTAAWVVQYAP